MPPPSTAHISERIVEHVVCFDFSFAFCWMCCWFDRTGLQGWMCCWLAVR